MWKVLEDSFYLNTFYTNLTKKCVAVQEARFPLRWRLNLSTNSQNSNYDSKAIYLTGSMLL